MNGVPPASLAPAERIMKVAIATACGRRKQEGEWSARELYLSARIRATCNHAEAYGLCPVVLSAEYGLVHADQRLQSYEREMDYRRAGELSAQVADFMRRFDWLVFFKAGAPDAYACCIRLAAAECGTPTALLGWANMGGFWDCLRLGKELTEGRMPKPGSLKSLELLNVKP